MTHVKRNRRSRRSGYSYFDSYFALVRVSSFSAVFAVVMWNTRVADRVLISRTCVVKPEHHRLRTRQAGNFPQRDSPLLFRGRMRSPARERTRGRERATEQRIDSWNHMAQCSDATWCEICHTTGTDTTGRFCQVTSCLPVYNAISPRFSPSPTAVS